MRRYTILVAASYLANVGIVSGLVALGLPAIVSKLIATVMLTVVNFAVYRYWVFAADPVAPAGPDVGASGPASGHRGTSRSGR